MAYKYYKDNRSFIDACVKTGDAIVVNEEVDWDLYLGPSAWRPFATGREAWASALP